MLFGYVHLFVTVVQ